MIPVVLSGGSGTRLWPISRESVPKQFAELFDESLMIKTLRRLSQVGSPWVVTVQSMKTLTERSFQDLGLPKGQILYEPMGRNTAPAIALLCKILESQGKTKETIGIFPADHLIQNEELFIQGLRLADQAAQEGHLVTLGIQPDHPATGYGYIEVGELRRGSGLDEGEPSGGEPPRPEDRGFPRPAPGLKAEVQKGMGSSGGEPPRPEDRGFPRLYETKGFKEKPTYEKAVEFLKTGRFFWNAGIFVFRVEEMIRSFQTHAPAIWTGLKPLKPDLSNLKELYQNLEPISIDYAIAEKVRNQVCVSADFGWSDVGSWEELAKIKETEKDTESTKKYEIDSNRNFVFSSNPGERIYTLLGVEDLIVVDSQDCLLISKRGKSQKVKDIVNLLKKESRKEAQEHAFDIRPWGRFDVLKDTPLFKSKVITVEPGHQLSYQSHSKRAEHWIILTGNPEVVLNDEILRPEPGQAVYIPIGAKHRIRNPGKEPVQFVEVQVGTYFGEDDIVRYQDDYKRS